MTGKEFRKELKRLFKELELDDIEIGISNIGVLYVDNVDIDKLLIDDSLTEEEKDKIWEDRKQYCFNCDKDKNKLLVEEQATRIY